MTRKSFGAKALGGCLLSLALTMGLSVAAPSIAQAKTYYLDSDPAIDQTWGKAWISDDASGGRLSERQMLAFGKQSVNTTIANESNGVNVLAGTNGATVLYSGTDYSGRQWNSVTGVSRRGTYTYKSQIRIGSAWLEANGQVHVVAQGSGSLSMTKTEISTAEASRVQSFVKLVNNTNTSVAGSTTYYYSGMSTFGAPYFSTSAPTQPGTYSVYASVPADKQNYLHGYITGTVSFSIAAPTPSKPDSNVSKSGLYYLDGREYDNTWTNSDLRYVYKSSTLKTTLAYDLMRNGSDIIKVSKKPVLDNGVPTLTFDITWETQNRALSIKLGDSYKAHSDSHAIGFEYLRYAKIDKTAPTIDATWSQADSKLTVKAEDVLSGLSVSEVNAKSVKVNGGAWQAPQDVSIAEPGTYSISLRAIDNAGNRVEVTKSIIVPDKVTPNPGPDPDDNDQNTGDGFSIQSESN